MNETELHKVTSRIRNTAKYDTANFIESHIKFFSALSLMERIFLRQFYFHNDNDLGQSSPPLLQSPGNLFNCFIVNPPVVTFAMPGKAYAFSFERVQRGR